MAESVRTRPASFQLRVPEITSATAQATAQGLNQLENSLSRMNSFFLQQAKQKAERDGLEYGARNKPTKEQIDQAFQSGEELELPGGKDTVFDRAARRAALEITSLEVEQSARQKINEIIAAGEVNNSNPAAISDDIDAVVHGYAATFDDTAPLLAGKVRANLSIWGNSKYSTYHSNYISNMKDRSQSSFVLSFFEKLEVLGDFITDGIPTQEKNAAGEIITRPPTEADFVGLKLAELRRAERLGLSPSMMSSLESMFDGKVKEAATTALSDAVLDSDDPQGTITNISKGQLDGLGSDNEFLDQAARNAITVLRGAGQSYSDIANELRTRRIQQINFETTSQAKINQDAELAAKGHQRDALRAAMVGDISAFNLAIGRLESTDPVKAAELEQQLQEAGGARTVSSAEAINELEALRANITIEDVISRWSKLTAADQRKYYERVEHYEDEEVKTALSFIKGTLKLPGNIEAISEGDPNFDKAIIFRQIQGRLETAAASAKRNEVDFDAIGTANELMAEFEQDVSDATTALEIDAAKNVITALNRNTDFDLDADDFQGAIAKINEMIAAKENGNNNDNPASYRNVSIAGLNNLKAALEKAVGN